MNDAYADIARAIKRRFGNSAQLDRVVVPTLGGSNRTVIFDLVQDASRRRLVSRQETFTDPNSPFLSTKDQFRTMRIVFAHGLAVPEPIFEYDKEDGLGNGFVTAYVEGETLPKTILRDPAFAGVRPLLAEQAGRLLAQLHSIASTSFAFLEKAPESHDALNALRMRYDSYDEPHPALELGFRWLEIHRPRKAQRSLVHGDFRTGNLMVNPNGIAAALDWECAHLGDGMEDLGWLCMRSWRFGQIDKPVGGFGSYDPFFAAYEKETGRKIDPEIVRYWEIFGLVRWAVINMMQAYGHISGKRKSVVFAACGRNASLIEYDLLLTLEGTYH